MSVEPQGPVVCPICRKSYALLKILKKHLITHEEEKKKEQALNMASKQRGSSIMPQNANGKELKSPSGLKDESTAKVSSTAIAVLRPVCLCFGLPLGCLNPSLLSQNEKKTSLSSHSL
jgi:hypothetical protein